MIASCAAESGQLGLKNPLTGSDIGGASSVRLPRFFMNEKSLSLRLWPSPSTGGSYKLIE